LLGVARRPHNTNSPTSKIQHFYSLLSIFIVVLHFMDHLSFIFLPFNPLFILCFHWPCNTLEVRDNTINECGDLLTMSFIPNLVIKFIASIFIFVANLLTLLSVFHLHEDIKSI
jgi:hypothetical protein